MDLMDLAFYLKPDDLDVNGNPVDPASVGLYNMAMAPETIVEVLFDPESGRAIERGIYREDWTFNLQLSAMDWSIEGLTKPTLHHVTYQGCRPGNISQRAATLYADRIDLDQLREATPGALATFERGSMELKAKWEYPNLGDHITSPTFAPRDCGTSSTQSAYAGGEPGGHDGYVLQPVMSDDGFRVELFDAVGVGKGPIAVLKGTNRECVPARPALGLDARLSRPGRRRASALLGRAERRGDGQRARRAPRRHPRGGRGVRPALLNPPTSPPDRQSAANQLAWNPKGMRWVRCTRATGPAATSRASSTQMSERSVAAS